MSILGVYEMNKLLGTNAVIEENRALFGKTSWPRTLLFFIAVYIIGSTITGIVSAVPQLIYIFSNEAVKAYMFSAGATADGVLKLIESEGGYPLWTTVFSLAANVFIGLAALFFCLKSEKRSLFGAGLYKKGAAAEYAAGFAIGALMFGAVILADVAAGEFEGIKLNSPVPVAAVCFMLFGFVLQSAGEELLMRSFFMVTASRCAGGVPVAAAANSLIFAALHLRNPGITPLAIINLTLYGLFASVYFLRRGSVWGICAVHAAWNFVQGSVFGAAVSGNSIGPSLFATSLSGGVFSGGAFGPEGGLSTTVVFALGIALVLLSKPKKIIPPPLRIGRRFYTSFPERKDFSKEI